MSDRADKITAISMLVLVFFLNTAVLFVYGAIFAGIINSLFLLLCLWVLLVNLLNLDARAEKKKQVWDDDGYNSLPPQHFNCRYEPPWDDRVDLVTSDECPECMLLKEECICADILKRNMN